VIVFLLKINIYRIIIFPIFCMGVKLGWRGEAYTGFWWGNLKERNHLGDPGVDGRIILR
jgi:hypothetical protein